jgi:hypothetical protein
LQDRAEDNVNVRYRNLATVGHKVMKRFWRVYTPRLCEILCGREANHLGSGGGQSFYLGADAVRRQASQVIKARPLKAVKDAV